MTEDSTRSDLGSVSRLIPVLKEGNQAAVEALWRCFFERLVRVAGERINPRLQRAVGPEDVAVDAFLDFCSRLARPDVEQRFPRLRNRQDLWKLLVRFTVWAAHDHNTKAWRRQEILAGESAVGPGGFALFAGGEPGPELAAAVDDLLAQLPDEDLRKVARLRLAGYSNAEIASAIDRGVSTVELKLACIRGCSKADWDALQRESEKEEQT